MYIKEKDLVDLKATKKEIDEMNYLLQNMFIKYELFDCVERIKEKNMELYKHCIRVAYLSLMIADNMDRSVKLDLFTAAILHDLGKVEIPNRILNKTSTLDDKERSIMNLHVLYGYKELISRYIPKAICYGVLMHHERLDGSGYYSVTMERIGLFARIIAIADVYDAMTTDRIYRKKLEHYVAWEYLDKNKIDKFDPELLERLYEYLVFRDLMSINMIC